MTRVLVTGCSGFVGRVLCPTLESAGYTVRGATRSDDSRVKASERVCVGPIGAVTDWSRALQDVDLVIHLAAKAHSIPPAAADAYTETNARGTEALAAAAAAATVRRFIYLSSVKVNGERSSEKPIRADDQANPEDAYAESKLEGERCLWRISQTSGMDAAVVRAPLVYGPGVRANFLRLLGWVDRGLPIPLGSVHNRRSLVNIWNLCDLLKHLLTSEVGPGGTWLVSDGEDVSTPELLQRVARIMNRRLRLLSVPIGLLKFAGIMVGRSADVVRLCDSLAVDISTTREEIPWSPSISLEEGLVRTVAWYCAQNERAQPE
jgi:nucleoside-diphosphate-sugar epimerase